MLYTVTNGGLQNGRPTQIGANSITIDNRAIYTFTVADFTTGTSPVYSDPEDDALAYIKILNRPGIGDLVLNGVTLVNNDIVSVGEITTGNLTYVSQDNDSHYYEVFNFDCADIGSNSLSGLDDGIMTMTVGEVENSPPDNVGDKTINLTYGQIYVFTSANFTSETTPAYSDPEGDAAYSLKILSLPATGELTYNGNAATVNQVVLMTEIDAGYLVYNPDISETGILILDFDFAIADSGSGQHIE